MMLSSSRRTRRRGIFVLLIVAMAGLMAFGTGPALAEEVVCGQVITEDTHVTNDLLNCPGDGLVIGAPDIRLNLGNHLIDGNGAGAEDDGIDNTGGFDNVRIVHGQIQEFQRGVGLMNADSNLVEHNVVTSNFDAIHLRASRENTIEHNYVFDNVLSGIVVRTQSHDNTAAHNSVHDNLQWGITGDTSNRNVYAHNEVFNNGSVLGIAFGGIEQFNSTGMELIDNKLFDNSRGIILSNTDNSRLEENMLWSNNGDGIRLELTSTGNTLLTNDSDENGDDGIDVAGLGNTITKNRADRNVDFGIFAVPLNVDGGGNRARDNGNPLQCFGVTCN